MFIPHVTTEGERWDQLAWRYYGNAHRYLPIVQANPHVPLHGALPSGLTLAIPVLEPQPATEDLPPWMR
ncbi:tail protein X [Pseudomonas mosselii]|uniref:Tail protein X n=1 Tax=Pseudomonas mosselii TaxID=78327 RepID=A0ABX9B3Z4_9PSED|nr:tail protein X [Pseudomonas mosselii]QZP26228.1 tail protein X [Pseudomonas mosselii]